MRGSTKWTAERVRFVQQIAQDVVSLNEPLTNDSESDNATKLGDTIPDPSPGLEELANLSELRDKIALLVDRHLTEQEKIVIDKRYGFSGERMTFEEIGDKYKLSRQRIEQVEKSALRKLRIALIQFDITGD